MTLSFELGNIESPKGHALLYFKDSVQGDFYATYIVLLPITVDVSKYVPPFLMNQVGEFGPGDMSAFAFPPAPEQVEGYDYLVDLAKKRQDDLLDGGEVTGTDVSSSMMKVNDVVQEYLELYEETYGTEALPLDESQSASELHVNDVLYSMMTEPDRLNELTKLVGRMRFAVESGENSIVKEVESDINALSEYLPETFQIHRLLKWATAVSDESSHITDLYLQRCFHLSREEYKELGEIEAQISESI
tara:strand:+ start:342 stop:1082 length:741 start_codon:yes stop_codon:yes gene_type:complete